MKAGEELGLPVRDPNAYGPYRDGVAMMDLYMKNGRRSDAFHEFLEPIMDRRRSLVVRRYAYVLRVLFHPNSDNHAAGVEYERHGRIYTARARKEVILSAGSVNSAKLLMLSGIGPRNDLERVGVRPKAMLK
jgi:choline dehydrogenase-like flavoprotein